MSRFGLLLSCLFRAASAPAAPALPALCRVGAIAARFRGETHGAVMIIFAIVLLPILLCVGAAVDYGLAAQARAKLNAAADMAALAAVNKAALTATAASAQVSAVSAFNAQTGGPARSGITTVNATVTDNGLGRTAVVSYSSAVPTMFMGLAGVKTMTVTGSSSATSNLPAYIDFYLLLDNTPSMGIGATPADVSTMVANTSDKCGFACHDLSDPTGNYYTLAKKLGVTMRIDVVRQATQQLMDTATSSSTVPNQFRAAIYTFGASCTQTGFTTITTLTASLSSAKTAASAIDLMTIPNQGYNNDQCTDFNGTLAAVNLAIPAPGDGSTAAAPQKVLFFVSDGVADAYYPSTCTRTTTGGRCQEPINAAGCTAIKNRGIKIAVLYTTYLPLPTNSWYNTWIAPFQSTIGTRMQSCASPGLYFEVSPTDGISSAMSALFQKAVASGRLTQ